MRASSGDSSSNRERDPKGPSSHRVDGERDEDVREALSSSSSGIVDELFRAMQTVGNAYNFSYSPHYNCFHQACDARFCAQMITAEKRTRKVNGRARAFLHRTGDETQS